MGKSRLARRSRGRGRGLGLCLDLDRERLVRPRRAVPVRAAVRAGHRRRARRRFRAATRASCCSRRAPTRPRCVGTAARSRLIARDAAFSGWEAEAVDVPDDPAETRAILAEVAAAYVERLLDTDGPRVVVLDDLHWLDPSSAGMVELLVERPPRSSRSSSWPTTRPGVGPELGGARPRRASRPGRPGTRRDGAARDDGRARRARRGRRPSDPRPDRRATPCSSARPSAPRSRTAPSSCATGGWCSSNRRPAPAADPARRARRAASTASMSRHATSWRRVGHRASASGWPSSRTCSGEPIAPGRSTGSSTPRSIVPSTATGTWRFSHPLVHDAAYAGHAGIAPAAAPRPARRPAGGGRRPSRSRRSRSIARPPAMRRGAIPLLVEAATAALAVGRRRRGGGFWRNAAELATEPRRRSPGSARAADAALEAARG